MHYSVNSFTPFRDYIDALVHPSVRNDALMAARHRAFIGSRILLGLTALAAFPVWLVFNGVPGSLEAFVFGWMLLPIFNAYFLSSSGRYETAHVLAALALTFLISVIAARTGGIGSFAAVWLAMVPLEAALSSSRRTVAASAALAVGAIVMLALGGQLDMLPPARGAGLDRSLLAGLAIALAALYATAVALRAVALARTGLRLILRGEASYHLLARNTTDAITRHGRNGAVLFVSLAAESLFGARAARALGHGLFDRVMSPIVRPISPHAGRRGCARRSAHARVSRAALRLAPLHVMCRSSSGSRCAAARSITPVPTPRHPTRTAARSWLSCARSPSARHRSRRSRRHAATPSAPTRPRATSSPP